MTATEHRAAAVVLPDTVATSVTLQVVDGRIAKVDPTCTTPPSRHIPGTLLPGFVDLQVNGAGGHSVDEATPEALDRIAAAVFAGGAVAFLPTLITAPWPQLLQHVERVAQWIAGWRGIGAEPLGLHLEGPFLATAGAHDAACFVDPTPERLEELWRAAAGRLRLVTLASSRAGADRAVAWLHERGVAVAIGHVTDVEGFAACVDAGARLVTHLFNVMGPLHHRAPGIAGLALDDPRLVCPLIVDGAHVHPAMVRLAFARLGPDRCALVTDAVAAAGMPDGDYRLAGQPVSLQHGVVHDAAGRLAGSALTMALAARNFLAFVPDAGPWTLARIAATNPARAVHATRYGSIEPGRMAAFTVLTDDGRIHALRL